MPLSGSLYELEHRPTVELCFQASPGISEFKTFHCRDGKSELKRDCKEHLQLPHIM